MIGFVLTGHGQFSVGLASAISMVAGDVPAFQTVPFEEESAATYGEALRDAITTMRAETDGVLVFVDLLGGTPFNQAMMIAADVPDVEVVTGANLPMVVELVITRPGMDMEQLIAAALQAGRDGITHQQLSISVDEEDFDDEGGI